MSGTRKFINREVPPRALDFIDKKPSPINTRPLHNDKIANRMREFNKLLAELEKWLILEADESTEAGSPNDSTATAVIEARQELRRFVRTIK